MTSPEARSPPRLHQRPTLGPEIKGSGATRWREEISRAEATMLKANWSAIYDRLCALSGAGARPFTAACCCVCLICSFSLHPVEFSLHVLAPVRLSLTPEPCKRPHFTLAPSTWPTNKRTWEGNAPINRCCQRSPRRWRDDERYLMKRLFCVTADSPITTSA